MDVTIAIGAIITAAVGWFIKEGLDQAKAYFKAYREESREWRESVDRRFDDIEDKLSRSIAQQAAQTRSDIIHKCHRYLDDMGEASIEEKAALRALYTLMDKIPKEWLFSALDALAEKPNRKQTQLKRYYTYPFPRKECMYGIPSRSMRSSAA